jgi:acyl-[acyl-carrier-protein]-phospholipid O-acyltransferase/long-chain-fatty-acid--[acyl-carrier-protein] ligase
MFMKLMSARRFAPLFWCQFFSAFNDNFLKTSLVFMILFKIGASDSEALISLAGAVFIFPFFVFSALGGETADRFDKARVAERLKFVEIAVAAVAVAGFWLHSIPVLFGALFLFGVISAMFGPIKYGILPDHLELADLPAGNALIEAATFVAILTGTIAGGLASRAGGDPASFASVMMGLALASWASARLIPPSGRAAPEIAITRNIFASTFRLIDELRARPPLWWGALVVSWFWLVGAAVLSLLPPLAKNQLGGDEDVVTMFLAIFSVAVGIGSAIAAVIARGRIVLWPIVAAAALMGVFLLDLGWGSAVSTPSEATRAADFIATSHGLRILADLAGLAAAGGLFIVPAFSAVQAWAGAERRARVVAAVNILNAAFMTGIGVAVAAAQKAGAPTPHLLMTMGIACFIAGAVIYRTLPRT